MSSEISNACPTCDGGIVLPEEPKIVVCGSHILVSVFINGYTITIAKRNLENFDSQDPYFFDSDYTIAASTGFLLWEANWLILRLLRSAIFLPLSPNILPLPPAPSSPTEPPHLTPTANPPSSPAKLSLSQILYGRRVLDLGSGTGLAGLCAAACGAHVLLTDLPSVCTGALQPNLQRNALTCTSSSPEELGSTVGKEGEPAEVHKALLPSLPSPSPTTSVPAASVPHPALLTPSASELNTSSAPNLHPASSTATAVAADAATPAVPASPATNGDGDGPQPSDVTTSSCLGHPWAGSVRVGRGTAAVMALDWSEPLEPQVVKGCNDPRDADFILAVDTIWLLDIFHSFINLVLAVLKRGAISPDPTHPINTAPVTTTANPTATATSATATATTTHHSITSATTGTATSPTRACFLAFVERASADSDIFLRKEVVFEELRSRGCKVEVLLAEDVNVDGVARPGRVLRVTLADWGSGCGAHLSGGRVAAD